MALSGLLRLAVGPGRNVVADMLEALQQDPARGESGDPAMLAQALSSPEQNRFDRIVDGLNRLPRPLMAYGVLGFFAVAMAIPDWFASRMAVLVLVPEPLWWLMGAVISLYFGARFQSQSQAFQRSMAETIARVSDLPCQASDDAPSGETERRDEGHNPALTDWGNRRRARSQTRDDAPGGTGLEGDERL